MTTQTEQEAVELYRRYRPAELDELIGQDDIIDQVESWLDNKRVPHFLLGVGPSGTGKTTLFRILKKELNCSDLDYREINAASDRGIDAIREIQSGLGRFPMNGDCRIYMVDECHQLTSQAQEAFLKSLEDTPTKVFFFFATTNPTKLIKATRTRATELTFKPIHSQQLQDLVTNVYTRETKKKLPEAVAKKLADVADGSARKVLVMLHQVLHMDMKDEDRVLSAIQSKDADAQAIDICRAILNGKSWKVVADILKEVTEEPETVRRIMLGYMVKVVLGGGKFADRASEIITEFEKPFYDSGQAGLVNACYYLSKQ